MIRRPPRSTRVRSSAASDVYKRQGVDRSTTVHRHIPPGHFSAHLCPRTSHAGLSASARATGPHREFNKYLGAPKTQPDVELRRGSGSIEINPILSATSRETLFSGTACPGLVIAPVYYCRRLLSPTSHTHIGLLSPPFSASATSWRLLGHQQARLQIRVRCRP